MSLKSEPQLYPAKKLKEQIKHKIMLFSVVIMIKSNCQRPVLCAAGLVSPSLDSVSVENTYKSGVVVQQE